jgi:hypothetical protein
MPATAGSQAPPNDDDRLCWLADRGFFTLLPTRLLGHFLFD